MKVGPSTMGEHGESRCQAELSTAGPGGSSDWTPGSMGLYKRREDESSGKAQLRYFKDLLAKGYETFESFLKGKDSAMETSRDGFG